MREFYSINLIQMRTRGRCQKIRTFCRHHIWKLLYGPGEFEMGYIRMPTKINEIPPRTVLPRGLAVGLSIAKVKQTTGNTIDLIYQYQYQPNLGWAYSSGMNFSFYYNSYQYWLVLIVLWTNCCLDHDYVIYIILYC